MENNIKIIPMMIHKNGSLQAYQIKIVNPGIDRNSLHTILFGLEETRNHKNSEIFILDNNNQLVSNQRDIINQLRDNKSKVNHISPSIRNRTVTFINSIDNITNESLRQYYLVEQDRMIYLGFIREDPATRVASTTVTIDPCGADINIKEVVQRLQGTSVQKLLDIWRVVVTSNQTQIIKYFIISDEKSIATEINLQESMIRYQGEKLGHFKNWFILASYKSCNDLSIENKSSLEYNVYWMGDIIKSSNNRTELLINPGIRYSKQKEYLCNPKDYATLQDQQYKSDEQTNKSDNPKQPVQNPVRTGRWDIIRPKRTEKHDKAIFKQLKALGIIEICSDGTDYIRCEQYGEPCLIYRITIKNTLDSHKQFIDQLLRHKIIEDFNTNQERGQWRFMQFRRWDHLEKGYDIYNPDLRIDSFISLNDLKLRKDSEILKNIKKETGDSNYLDK